MELFNDGIPGGFPDERKRDNMFFKPLTLRDVESVRPFFSKLNSNTCDFSVGGMFMWRQFFKMEFTIEEDSFFSRLYGDHNEQYYNLPISDNMGNAIKKLLESALRAGSTVKFCTVPEMYVPLFRQECNIVSITEQRDFFDYLYTAKDLIELKGKRYSGQRNHISQFKRSVDSWEFREINKDNVDRIIDFFLKKYTVSPDSGAYEKEENAKVLEVLQNMDCYGMTGGCLIADGEIVGFSLGEAINHTFYTHIEKADVECKGAYPMLVNQTAMKYAAENILYINREEDMGDAGLRTSKQSYHPVEMLKKYIIEVN